MSPPIICYVCNCPNHLARDCVKRQKAAHAHCYQCNKVTSSKIAQEMRLGTRHQCWSIPRTASKLDTPYLALLDSACSQSILSVELCRFWLKQDVAVTTLIGAKQACCKSGTVKICMASSSTATIDVLVMRGKPLDFNLLLGINAIKVFSGVYITQYGSAEFELLLGSDWLVKNLWTGFPNIQYPANWGKSSRVNCRLGWIVVDCCLTAMKSLIHPRDWCCRWEYCWPTCIKCILWRIIRNLAPMLTHSQPPLIYVWGNCKISDSRLQTYLFWTSERRTCRFMWRSLCGPTRQSYSKGSDIVWSGWGSAWVCHPL